MKTKILLWSIVSVLTVGTAGDAAEKAGDHSPFPESGRPQVIVLSDGTKLTLLGVTYGKRHVAPNFAAIGGFVQLGNWIDSFSNTTVVWIEAEHKTNQWPNYTLLVSDRANTACVSTEKTASSHVKDGVDVQGFRLDAFPRWDKETVLRIRPYGGAVSKEQFVIANPAPTAHNNWTPKPLPDTESDGDLEVTLTKLIAGAPAPYRQGRDHAPTTDPANQCVHLDFDFRQNGQSTTNWQPWPVRTSDAFGNQVRGVIYDYPTNGIYPAYPDRIHPSFPPQTDGYFYRPGLWPDEPAWKVRLEFIRRSGFSADEIVTFTNLLVRPGSQQDADDEWSWDASNTNFTFIAQAKVNGVQVKLLPPLLYAPEILPGEKHIMVVLYADPNPTLQDMRLTLLQATDDQGKEVPHPFPPAWAGHFSLDFPKPGDVKSLNLKLALHKSRFVEFIVKPTKQ